MSDKLHVDAMAFTHQRRQLHCNKNFTDNSTVRIPLGSRHVKPESVKLFISGKEEIIPQYFSNTGTPSFSPEASLILYCKDMIATERRLVGQPIEDFFISADYEETSYDFSLEEIDSLTGIITSLSSLKAFNELCGKRKAYSSKFKEHLHAFVIFGRILLDENGYTRRMTRLKNHHYDVTVDAGELPIVCTREQFEKMVTFFETSNDTNIPKSGDVCPCCGKAFEIDDLKEHLSTLNGKISHDKCMKNYEFHLEIKKLIFDIIDQVFEPSPKFEILPNPSTFNIRTTHLPWFLVHTRFGDIKIGSRYDKIYIEWQENYKPFDIAIFNNFHNTTKWYAGSSTFKEIPLGTAPTSIKRVVCAQNRDDAIAMLRLATKSSSLIQPPAEVVSSR